MVSHLGSPSTWVRLTPFGTSMHAADTSRDEHPYPHALSDIHGTSDSRPAYHALREGRRQIPPRYLYSRDGRRGICELFQLGPGEPDMNLARIQCDSCWGHALVPEDVLEG